MAGEERVSKDSYQERIKAERRALLIQVSVMLMLSVAIAFAFFIQVGGYEVTEQKTEGTIWNTMVMITVNAGLWRSE